MTTPTKTRDACRLIGCTLPQLTGAIRNGKVVPPPKDSSGDYVWDTASIEAARKAIFVDRRKRVRPEPGEKMSANWKLRTFAELGAKNMTVDAVDQLCKFGFHRSIAESFNPDQAAEIIRAMTSGQGRGAETYAEKRLEKARASRLAEKFSEGFSKIGKMPQSDIMAGFVAAQEVHPNMTAAEFFGMKPRRA